MKQYTIEDFENFERVDGRITCPTGDYTAVKEFPERCSFGERCRCEFGEFTKVLSGGGFGHESRTTYFFVLENKNISVRCGCFAGTLEKWKSKVKETHGDSKLARAYLALAVAVEIMAEDE